VHQSLISAVVIGLIGGVAVGLQGPLSSLMSQRIGTMGSVFIVHIGGAIIAGMMLLVLGAGNLAAWRKVPWYALVAGVFGVIVISAVSYTIPRIGAAVTVTLIITAQLILSTVLDNFGLLGTSVRPFDLPRAAGIAILLVGTWLIVR
jgi:transporter family-2 protein